MSGLAVDYEEYIGREKEKEVLRQSLSPSVFLSTSSEFVTKQLSLIDQELRSIVVQASQQSDYYWSTVTESRDDYKGWDSFCRIGTRIVFRDGSFSAEWFRNRYVKQDDGAKSKVYSTYLRKGKGFSYPMTIFNNEPEWVRSIVALTEREYADLRERAATLTKMRTLLKVYDRLAQKQSS